MDLVLLVLCGAAALVFAGVQTVLPVLLPGIRPFWVAFWSFGLAILVFASRSLLGIKL